MANPTGKGGFQTRKHQINRKGRPKTFDALRILAQQIAHECAIDPKTKEALVISGRKVTVAEAILRTWARSTNSKLQTQFMEVAFGKVPTPVDLSGSIGVHDDLAEWKAARTKSMADIEKMNEQDETPNA